MSFFTFDRASISTHSNPDHFFMPTIVNQNNSSSSSNAIPKLGQTRCYWALLSAELEFLYVDPVLHTHLEQQASVIIGRKLLEFVHPDEHASAQQDLGKVLESRTLHGSVTRVRYSRLGRVRTRLGYAGSPDKFTDEDKVSFDEDYMACDLVINWAAEGLVLCFIHAVVDMSPQDNDEHNRTHWTNWCGTPRMNVEDGSQLYHALFHIAPHAAQGAPPPTRVFQILHNSTDRPTLFSWPGEGYIPADYGRLANDVQIGGANGSDAKTSCTRRYKAQQLLNSADGSIRDVESIFIPHGHIIFACHKATPQRPRGHPNSYPLYPTPAQFYDSQGHPHMPYYPPMPVPSQAQIDTYPNAMAGEHTYSYHPQQPSVPSSEQSTPGGSRGTGTHSPYPHWSGSTPQPPHQPPQPSYMDNQNSTGQRYSTQVSYLDEVPPPRQRGARLSPDNNVTGTRETYTGGGRAGGNPPVGVSRCAACKSTTSPEWRKGPSGRKDLCNACGLRYSRARAKKEGVASQKRRKETGGGKTDPPPTAPSSKRRTYADFAFEDQGGVGGGSVGGSTPSPSPPHDYSPQHHQHTQSQPQATSSGLYPYDPRQDTMYLPSSSNPYSTSHSHTGGYLGSSGGHLGMSSTAVSSYERTGMSPETKLEHV